MNPVGILHAGAKILEPTVSPYGFQFHDVESGRASGGHFAVGEFATGARRIEFHFQWSLGFVSYGVGESFVDHREYMDALGATGLHRYPGVSEDPLQAFRDLAHDIGSFATEFLTDHLVVFPTVAAAAAIARASAWRRQRASYAGDDSKRADARARFQAKDYQRVIELLQSVSDPGLLDLSETKMLEIARRRIVT